jgi:hypothetical protein
LAPVVAARHFPRTDLSRAGSNPSKRLCWIEKELAMCQRIACAECKKPTYAGCGRHIEAVLGDVPPEARCVCRTALKQAVKGEASKEPSFFRRILGR